MTTDKMRTRLAKEDAQHAKEAVDRSLLVDLSPGRLTAAAPCRVLAIRDLGDETVQIDVSLRMSSGVTLPMTWTVTPDVARSFYVGGTAAVLLAPATAPEHAPEGTSS